MAHELDTHRAADGTVQAAAIFGRNISAWHRLGTTVEGAFSAEEAMTLAHLDYEVRKATVLVDDVNTEGVTRHELRTHVATVRSNPWTGASEVLGIVGSGYEIIQNREHADMLNALTHTSGASFDTAGALRGGREVFISMQMQQHLLIGGVDRVDLNIVALNSHDGSSAFRLLLSPVRVVCANTQALAIASAKASFSIRHTTNARANLQQAREALDMTLKYNEAFEAEANRLADQTMSDGQFWKIVGQLWPVEADAPKRAQTHTATRNAELARLWHSADTQRPIAGTRWAGVQAITEYVDHAMPVRVRDGKDVARAERAIGDQGMRLKRRAHELVAAL